MKAYQPITDYFNKSSVKTCIFDPCDLFIGLADVLFW